MAAQYVRVLSTQGVHIGVGEVVPAPDEGTDGFLYVMDDKGQQLAFNLRHVINYFTRPLTEGGEEQCPV